MRHPNPTPKSDARLVSPEDIKKFLAWRKSKGMDPGTTLYTDRVILHNFFNKLGIDNSVRHVPRLPKFRKRPVAYTDERSSSVARDLPLKRQLHFFELFQSGSRCYSP